MAQIADKRSSAGKLAWESPRLTKITPDCRLVELLLTANGYSAEDARLLAVDIIDRR